MANGMHADPFGGCDMKNEPSFKTAVCSTYERLLKQSQAKCEVWETRRKEACQGQSNDNESDDELLGLQADYAKAYHDLRTHVRTCTICQYFSKTADQIAVSRIFALLYR